VTDELLDAGNLQFSVDSRILRELGERLVRRPETALIELIKNSYDADATQCVVELYEVIGLVVEDNGTGMTLDEFKDGWMRIGTAAKASRERTPRYGRYITGEKGIGRFSVRFLGEHLRLTSVADDSQRGIKTRLTATFEWPEYDASADIGLINVPYELTVADRDAPTGTNLHISKLRNAVSNLELKQVRTATIGLVSPLSSLVALTQGTKAGMPDPGFQLILVGVDDSSDDIAQRVLGAFELCAKLSVNARKLNLQIFSRDQQKPYLEVSDSVPGQCGNFSADIRFFPRRPGAFSDLGVDGRRAYTWTRDNSGVAIFDRNFRVSPYGEPGNDWLQVTADAASNSRRPRSSLSLKHFPMSEAEQASTSDNWMLRLPASGQLIGVVQVVGARSDGGRKNREEGLVAAADREGFIANEAFRELADLVRGAVEAIAVADRRRQKEREEAERQERLRRLREQAAAATREIERNENLPADEKERLVSAVTEMSRQAEAHERATQERLRQLEIMSLLGVVAGFMTHEFGVAIDELDQARRVLEEAAVKNPALKSSLDRLSTARSRLAEFMDYSTAYIRGSRTAPDKSYPALPRIRHVRETFERYAKERGVTIESGIANDVFVPPVPTSLYDGILLNLLTNALKATTAVSGPSAKRVISFNAWNESGWHYLEVADTGIGIPTLLRDQVFDPLFTTTESRNDPLGSGMGLGLALVKASVEAFGGGVQVIDPPAGFSTCVQVRLPLISQE